MSGFSSIGSFFLDIVETVVITASILLVFYLLILQPHQVNGQSMVPTFESGEFLITDKVSYKIGDPKRGDIIVFHAPEAANCPKGTGCDFIKRILAEPGDSVRLSNSTFFVNGQKLAEPYIPAEFETKPGDFTRGSRTATMGPREYFVVGDNRPYSSDSRQWGPIQRSDIVGKALFRYWPFDKMGIIEDTKYAIDELEPASPALST